ncbi:13135_t:CDS:1, partial [Entrophospora sp. SA101]
VVYVSDTDSNCTGEYNADTSDTLSDNSDTTIILSTTTRRTDIISNFPLELCWHIMGYLDLFNICQAAQVSKRWRCIVDSDRLMWKSLLLSDGFDLEIHAV